MGGGGGGVAGVVKTCSDGALDVRNMVIKGLEVTFPSGCSGVTCRVNKILLSRLQVSYEVSDNVETFHYEKYKQCCIFHAMLLLLFIFFWDSKSRASCVSIMRKYFKKHI